MLGQVGASRMRLGGAGKSCRATAVGGLSDLPDQEALMAAARAAGAGMPDGRLVETMADNFLKEHGRDSPRLGRGAVLA